MKRVAQRLDEMGACQDDDRHQQHFRRFINQCLPHRKYFDGTHDRLPPAPLDQTQKLHSAHNHHHRQKIQPHDETDAPSRKRDPVPRRLRLKIKNKALIIRAH